MTHWQNFCPKLLNNYIKDMATLTANCLFISIAVCIGLTKFLSSKIFNIISNFGLSSLFYASCVHISSCFESDQYRYHWLHSIPLESCLRKHTCVPRVRVVSSEVPRYTLNRWLQFKCFLLSELLIHKHRIPKFRRRRGGGGEGRIIPKGHPRRESQVGGGGGTN